MTADDMHQPPERPPTAKLPPPPPPPSDDNVSERPVVLGRAEAKAAAAKAKAEAQAEAQARGAAWMAAANARKAARAANAKARKAQRRGKLAADTPAMADHGPVDDVHPAQVVAPPVEAPRTEPPATVVSGAPAATGQPDIPAQRTDAPAAGVILSGKGRTGIVTVDEHFVTITRKGAAAKLQYGWTRGAKRIAIGTITAVQFKKPGLATGYIQFTLAGGSESTRGVVAAGRDENSVLFVASHLKEFEAIRNHIEQAIAARHAPAAAVPVINHIHTAPAAGDFASQLRELAALRDEGLLSPEEFEQQKQHLLDRRNG
jgi:hypothetical protein